MDDILDIKNDIIKTILYFDVFNYPLTKSEICSFSVFSDKEVDAALKKLVADNYIQNYKDLYGILLTKKIANKRMEGNKRADKILNKARNISRFISYFPFVRAVFISGSLSKGYFKKKDDIDYFIITKEGRLWTARTVLIFFKKVFLLNSKKYFCLNYFMSEANLTIAEKNRFTATECITLLPMAGKNAFQQLLKQNSWVLANFPNFKRTEDGKIIEYTIFKKISEKLLKEKFGDFLERNFMKITQKHQQIKFKKRIKKSEFDLAFKGNKSTSKHHPKNHQIKTRPLQNIL